MINKKKTLAILVGAGNSSRVNKQIPKQYLPIVNQLSPFDYVLETFINHSMVDYVLPVISQEHQYYYSKIEQRLSNKFLGLDLKLLPFCTGGKERKDSVYKALSIIDGNAIDKILIHDVARPFVSHKIITETIVNIAKDIGVAPAIEIVDTVKRVRNGLVYEEVDRGNLHSLQTPQGFMYEDLFNSYNKFSSLNFSDDTSYLLKNNMNIKVIKGDVLNSKITFYNDIDFLVNLFNFKNKSLISQNKGLTDNEELSNNGFQNISKPTGKRGILVGQGVDVHEFSKVPQDNQELFLAGIKIPYHKGLKGHSDADVILHALVDAILGALGKGDIGDYYPPSNPSFKGAPSKVFLEFARDLLYESNIYINNIDITVLAEEPKITKYKKAMQESIASILGIESSLVNLKATTAEKLGFIGRGEGIVAMAIVTLHGE